MSLLSAILLAASFAGASCEAEATTCRTIAAAEAAFADMLATGDPAPFVAHVDERAIYVTADGVVRSRDEMIALVRGGPRHATARLDSLKIRRFGDTAIAVWTETWTDPGRSGTTSGVDTWLRRDGRWRVIATREARNAG